METIQYKYARYDKRGKLKPYTKNNPEFSPLANGGVTVAVVVDEDGEIGVGMAVCQPEDTFNYGIGRTLALLRATGDWRKGVRARTRKSVDKIIKGLNILSTYLRR